MKKMSNFRWIICSLLFFATTVNYMDRQVLSLTYKDFIAPVFGWTDNDYGTITGVFSIIYAICNLFAGKLIDKLGTKKGYLWAIFIWSLGACLHAGCGLGTEWLKGLANIICLGKLWAETQFADLDVLEAALKKCVPPKHANLLEPNLKALHLGIEL